MKSTTSGHMKAMDERTIQSDGETSYFAGKDAKLLLPQRPEDGHKGTFGKVYVLGGSIGFTGAPVFAADAAVRCGSGLVFAGVPRYIYEIIAGKCREAMPFPLPCDEEGRLTKTALEVIKGRMEGCDAGLIGPGLGRSEELEILVKELLETVEKPLVLDADGLYAVRNKKKYLKERAKRGLSTVLTPHDGEFAYLGGDLTSGDRLKGAREFAEDTGCVLVLKGHRTIVAKPGGRVWISTVGNCGMAKGGSGDILAGMILSFLGQGMSPEAASNLAVWIHGRAGDLCAEKFSTYAMRPTDLLEELPQVFLELCK